MESTVLPNWLCLCGPLKEICIFVARFKLWWIERGRSFKGMRISVDITPSEKKALISSVFKAELQ